MSPSFAGYPKAVSLIEMTNCLLFSAYLDLPKHIDCNYNAYADDVQIFKSGTTQEIPQIVEQINLNLDKIRIWCENNGLMLNANKTQAILFQKNPPTDDIPRVAISNIPISYENSIDLLGIKLTYKL